jgi:amidase
VAVAPQRPHRDEVGRDPGRLGIGVTAHAALGTPVHRVAVPPCVVRRPLLDELGHDVVDAEPALNGDRFLRGFLAMVLHPRLMVDEAKARSGCGDDAFEGEMVLLAAVGRTPSANPTWAATTPARRSPRRTTPWRRATGQPPAGSREP